MAEPIDLAVRMSGAQRAASDAAHVGKGVRGIGKDADYTSRRLRFANSVNRKFVAGLRSIGTTAKRGAFIGIAALGAEVIRATKGWADHEAVVRRSNAVIRSTQGVANVTTKHIQSLTDSIERQTGVDGDLAASGANLLLTFTNIRNETGKGNKIFDQATGTVVNMSKALGQDTKSSAIQLGKALNDPVKGITALSRVGVSFTEDQKKQIKTLVESGKTMDAQKIILQELGKEFPKVKATPWERMLVVFRKIEDTIGKAVLPIFNRFVRTVEPKLDHVANAAARIFDDKNLNWQQKFQRLGQSIRHWFGPMAGDMVQGLRDAHLDQKLQSAVREAEPKILETFRQAGPPAARALWQGFVDAPLWAKVVTAGFLLTRLGLPGGGGGGKGGIGRGPFATAGRAGAGVFRLGFNTAMEKLSLGKGVLGKVATFFTGRGTTPANPLFVANVTEGMGGKTGLFGKIKGGAKGLGGAAILEALAGGGAGVLGAAGLGIAGTGLAAWYLGNHGPLKGSAAQSKKNINPMTGQPYRTGADAARQPKPRGPGGYAPGVVEAYRGREMVRANTEAYKGYTGTGTPIVIHSNLVVDGKVIAKAVHRASTKKKSTK